MSSALCKQGAKKWAARVAEEETSQQLANLPTFYVEGYEIEQIETFTYLGRTLMSIDDDLPACLHNLAKAKVKWGALSRVLKQDGARIAYKSRIYLVVVSTILLYGAETWVITDCMHTLLESFHHSCTKNITRNYLRSVSDPSNPDVQRWVYPSTEEVLKRAKLLPIMDYIHQRREVFYKNYLAFSTTFSESK